MSYNPADYKAVEDKAKSMDKKELENYYVSDRSGKHYRGGEAICMIFLVLLAIFALGFIGYTIVEIHMTKEVSNNIQEVTEDVCPLLGSGYISDKFFASSSYYPSRIVCNDVNSIPR